MGTVIQFGKMESSGDGWWGPRGGGWLCVSGFLTSVPSVHHGPSVAQPIHLDSTQLSKKFISDYLWSLVDTDW